MAAEAVAQDIAKQPVMQTQAMEETAVHTAAAVEEVMPKLIKQQPQTEVQEKTALFRAEPEILPTAQAAEEVIPQTEATDDTAETEAREKTPTHSRSNSKATAPVAKAVPSITAAAVAEDTAETAVTGLMLRVR